MDPISIAAFIFKGTFDFMSMMLRRRILEELREGGDVTDRNFRMLILRDIDKVSFQLNSQSRKDLKSSKSHYKDGLGFLNKVLTAINIGRKGTETVQTTKPPGGTGQLTFYAKKTGPTEDVKCLTEADLDESSKKNLEKAREYFNKASDKARDAFHDTSLEVKERLEAMYIRVMATILENVETPSSMSILCQTCVSETQDIPKVKNIFDAVITKRRISEQDIAIFVGVCKLYRVIYDAVTQLNHQCSGPWTWPCIEIKGKKMSHKIDPLRDVRVAEALCQLQREKRETVPTSIADLPVVSSFGSTDDGKLISPRSIATNTKGQFIIVDDGDRTIKVYDEAGKKFNSFRPLCSHLADEDILSVFTDREDNFFILIKLDKYRYKVHVFKEHFQFSHKFPLREGLERCSPSISGKNERVLKKYVQFSHKFPLREGVVRCSPIINDNNEVLVIIEQKDQNITVEKYKSNGDFVGSFGHEILKEPKDMTIANKGRLMVLDGLSRVAVFDAEGKYRSDLVLPHEGIPPEAIAFHSESKHVIVSNSEAGARVKMSIYNEGRDCVNTIYQGEERKITEGTECVPPKIAVTKDGRIAILAGIVGESKVIVV